MLLIGMFRPHIGSGFGRKAMHTASRSPSPSLQPATERGEWSVRLRMWRRVLQRYRRSTLTHVALYETRLDSRRWTLILCSIDCMGRDESDSDPMGLDWTHASKKAGGVAGMRMAASKPCRFSGSDDCHTHRGNPADPAIPR
jgi:hypothetical protein